MANYVQSARQPDAIGSYIERDGDLTCPDCKEPLDLQQMASAPPEVFSGMGEIKRDFVVRKEVALVERDMRAQAQAEMQELMAKDVDERAALMLRKHIVDDILTLRCPRCMTAFLDFEGCFALQCGNRVCNAGFCGWCLKDCQLDAHAHVAVCNLNRGHGGYFGDIQLFNAAHRDRRRQLVKAKIDAEGSPSVRRQALQLLRKDLADLGIDIAPDGGNIGLIDESGGGVEGGAGVGVGGGVGGGVNRDRPGQDHALGAAAEDNFDEDVQHALLMDAHMHG
jgi:hypothetical protein